MFMERDFRAVLAGNLFSLCYRQVIHIALFCPVLFALCKVKITGLYCLKCYDIME